MLNQKIYRFCHRWNDIFSPQAKSSTCPASNYKNLLSGGGWSTDHQSDHRSTHECWSSSDHQHQQFLINTDYTLNNFLSLWVGSNRSHLWTGWQINIKHTTKLFDYQNSLSCIKWVSITGKKPTKLYYWNQSSLIFTSGELNSQFS